MPTSDVVFINGAVFSGTGEPAHGLAVAVTGDRITAVVPESEAEGQIGASTRVIDLDGALLAPGFQDAHIHPVGGGVELLQCNLTEATDAAASVAAVQEYAEQNPDEPWILGGGWSMDHFPGGAPLRGLLDEVVADRPVMILSRDHHSAWANTAAIEAAGIDASTPDPLDGRIERDADGFPAGTFHEGAMELFAEVRPELSPELAYRGLLRAQSELLALGVTAWQDAMVGTVSGVPDPLGAYLRASDEGTLLARVVGAQWWQRTGGIDQVERFVSLRDEIAARGDDRLRLGTVKIMVDGVAENQTAAMLTPYRDHHGHDTANSGMSFVDPELLRDYATAVDAAGMQLHFHALGDRAVREALDAVAAAREANGSTDGRHHLAHLQVVDHADVPRFAELEAIANIQALWAAHEDQLDELTLPFLRDGAEERHYPFGDFDRAGVRLAAGSDWPVTTADPMDAIHTAVNRQHPGSATPALGGEKQCIDLATAMAAYTSGSAYVNHRDDETGSIRPGYLADLIILEPDPFTLPADQIHRATVVATWIDGTLVYSASSDHALELS